MTSGCIQAHAEPTSGGVTRPVTQHRPRPQHAAVAVLTVLLLGVAAGCTSDQDDPAGQAAPSALPSRSLGAGPTLASKPVPLRIEVGKVRGDRLGKDQRRRLEREVAGTLSRYFDAAYLGGDYPRADFSRALGVFTLGAAQRAGRDRELLTNSAVGRTTQAVVPRVKEARIDVFKPNRFVAGLTARIRLVFVQERVDGAAQRVTVRGRLLLTRKKSGPWQVFGYDITRFSVPAKGATR